MQDPAASRVVITGIGLISPLGNSPSALWEALSSGRSGVGTLSHRVEADFPTMSVAEAGDFSGCIGDFGELAPPQKKAIRKGLKVMCRETQMGVAAAQRAVQDAKILDASIHPERIGVTFGSDYMLTLPDDFIEGVASCRNGAGEFEYERWALDGLPNVTPLWLLKYLPNMPASHIAIYNDFRGPNNSITQREASANLAVGEAYRTIARGAADVIVAGSTGTRVHPMRMVHSVTQEEVVANDIEPDQASRPFDLNRSGMVLGEGCGALVLEALEVARGRGATIYGEVVGFASSTVTDRQAVGRRDVAMSNVMRLALDDASLTPDAVGHVHAHGLSTQACDIDEAKAIGTVFGERSSPVPVVAAKSNFGNLGAGSGMVEMIGSLRGLHAGHLFPTLNYNSPDPKCPISVVTSVDTGAGVSFLNVNVTPQGQASAVIVRLLP